jgi:hypothetical protein
VGNAVNEGINRPNVVNVEAAEGDEENGYT